MTYLIYEDFSGSARGKESACQAGDVGLIRGSEDPLEKTWQSTPVFLPGKFDGQRSLVG